MTAATAFARWPVPFAPTIGRWYDQADNGRATLIVLGLFVVCWTLFHTILYAPLGLHPDLAEVFAWGRHPAAGYYKHPPLAGLMSAAWFAVFPAADWAFHLLAMVNAAAGLYAADLIARRYVSGDKRLLVLLLLLMLPFYQFHGQRFASNQVLLSTWPIATYCFLRAFETRAFGWAAAAGLAAALAMLGKYYSIYLIGGFVLAALVHPARIIYLTSPSPWISAATGLAVLTPHLYWLWTTGFQPFVYAYAVHGNGSLLRIGASALSYVAGCAGYAALPVAVYLIAVRPDRATLAKTLWPGDPSRRMIVVLLAGFLFLPVITAPFAGVLLTSLWTMQAWFLLPVVLLGTESAILTRGGAIRIASCLLMFTALAVTVAAPVRAWMNFHDQSSDRRAYSRDLSVEITRQWRAIVGRPLAIVMGDARLSAAVTFYSPDHPDSVPDFQLQVTPWITPQLVQRLGWVAVCQAEDQACLTTATQLSASMPRARRLTLTIVPRFLGRDGVPAKFTVIIVPPSAVTMPRSATPGWPA